MSPILSSLLSFIHVPNDWQWPILLAWPWLFAWVFLPMAWLKRRREDPLGHTNVTVHKNLRSVPWLGRLATLLLASILFATPLMLAEPVIPYTVVQKSVEVRDIILAIDKSGSMSSTDIEGTVNTLLAPGTEGCPLDASNQSSSNGQPSLRRIDAACFASLSFALSRPNDRVGFILFDDQAYWLIPPFYDNKIVVNKAKQLNSQVGGGTNFEGPTKNNPRLGPIQMAINLFTNPKYEHAQTKVLIMVTDGEDSIGQERQADLAQQLTKNGIHMYVLGVGADWKGSNVADLQKVAESIGGKVFRVADAGAMQTAFAEINQLEKSKVHLQESTGYLELYWYLAGFVLLAGIFYLIIAFITREKP